MKVAAVIPAAGAGVRMGGKRKQFRLLGGESLLVHSVRAFAGHPLVHQIVVAVPEDAVDETRSELAKVFPATHVVVVAGGVSRQESVSLGLSAVDFEHDLVLIHDGVRPFVTSRLISAVIDATERFGAAAPAIAMTDTVRRADGAFFGETVERTSLYRMQTPQGFRLKDIQMAHRQLVDGESITDDVMLIQRTGQQVHCVEGDELNIKVTTRGDWDLAEVIAAMLFERTAGA
jgi:2-C-methyl-D-erythritol 4-phosphate cytidylyltransferase